MDEKVYLTSCASDCGGRCLLRVHTKDGVISRISTDEGKEPQMRACCKGLLEHLRVYSPDRLKYPLKRAGERGEGRFQRISWDEALDTIAEKIKYVNDKYGTRSIFCANWSGSFQVLLHTTIFGFASRFFNFLSQDGLGCTKFGASISGEGANAAARWMYGAGFWQGDANEPDDYPNSKLIILWGFNPGETIMGNNTSWWLSQAKEAGAKIICVDPCFTNTAAVLADEWIPIRPSTDAAMLIAMAYVMIKENLQDQIFLDKYTVGFEIYKDYVTGRSDGIPKTPGWAENITGVAAEVIVKLAREYASTKPASLIQGLAPGRTARGEEYHRAACVLTAMTGNIGKHGGNSHCFGGGWRLINLFKGSLPTRRNPKDNVENMFGGTDHRRSGIPFIKPGLWADCVLQGKAGGYPADIKLVYIIGGNIINSCQNTKKGINALKSVESVFCHELFMTPTAKFADILLPVAHTFERSDIGTPWQRGLYGCIYMPKILETAYERKTDFEIFTALAERIGLHDYNTRSDEEWLKALSPVEDFEAFRQKGLWTFEQPEPFVALKKRIEDPENNPFPTPSGKIEIYSKSLAELAFEESFYREFIPPHPAWREPPETLNDPMAKKYPLQLTTPHFKLRTHSQWWNVAKIRALYEHQIWMNSKDARKRGIAHGDRVIVFNDRGRISVQAKVTERMMPGVVRVYEGAWYDPDENGVDRGGCVNMLIEDSPSPAGAQNYNTCLVEVVKEKVE